MVNICESLINVVKTDKPNGLNRLEPKGKWPGIDTPSLSIADAVSPADKRDLTHSWYLYRTW